MKYQGFLLGIILSAIGLGCGKYAPPLPPEAVSPKSVNALTVAGEVQGVRFHWTAPEENQRSKELSEIDGYKIQRKLVMKDSDIADDGVEFEDVGFIEDTHLKLLKEKRDEAVTKGTPVRKAKVDDELKKFEYLDSTVEAGKTYLYQVVPINQGDVEGEVTQLVRVLYRGESSEVLIIPFSRLEELSF